MGRLWGGLLMLSGIGMLFVGLCAAITKDFTMAMVLLVPGGAACWLASRTFRDAATRTPAAICRRITQLAIDTDGELTVAEAAARLNLDVDKAQRTMRSLVEAGVAIETIRGGVATYSFPGADAGEGVRCPYCGRQVAGGRPGGACPSCGGALSD